MSLEQQQSQCVPGGMTNGLTNSCMCGAHEQGVMRVCVDAEGERYVL